METLLFNYVIDFYHNIFFAWLLLDECRSMINNNFYTTNPRIWKGINKEYFMKLKILQAAVACLILSVCNIANAGLINYGQFTTDTTQNLDWLDITSTTGMSYDEVTLALNSSLGGWRYATQAEFNSLVLSIMPDTNHIDPNSNYTCTNCFDEYANFIELIGGNVSNGSVPEFQLLGNVLLDSPDIFVAAGITHSTAVARFTGQNFDGFGLGNSVSIDRPNLITHGWSQPDNAAQSDISTFLVRATQVPEPSTLAIFALGIMGLAARRFKKQ